LCVREQVAGSGERHETRSAFQQWAHRARMVGPQPTAARPRAWMTNAAERPRRAIWLIERIARVPARP
jgi:hypothetical protein